MTEIPSQPSERLGSGEWYQRANQAYRTGRVDRAIEICLQAVEDFTASGLEGQLPYVYHFLGDVECRRKDYGSAEHWYSMAIACDERLNNLPGLAKSCNNMSVVANARGMQEAARMWIDKSLQIKEELGDRGGLAYGYHQRGVVACVEGDLDEAERWFQKALQIKEESGNPTQLAYTYFALMDTAQNRGDSQKAMEWKARAADALNQIKEVGELLRWGLNAEERESYNEAKVLYHRACELAHAQGLTEAESASYNRAGGVAVQLGDLVLALHCFETSSQLDERMHVTVRCESNKHWLDWLKSNGASNYPKNDLGGVG